jgi:hypothetical protein
MIWWVRKINKKSELNIVRNPAGILQDFSFKRTLSKMEYLKPLFFNRTCTLI